VTEEKIPRGLPLFLTFSFLAIGRSIVRQTDMTPWYNARRVSPSTLGRTPFGVALPLAFPLPVRPFLQPRSLGDSNPSVALSRSSPVKFPLRFT